MYMAVEPTIGAREFDQLLRFLKDIFAGSENSMLFEMLLYLSAKGHT